MSKRRRFSLILTIVVFALGIFYFIQRKLGTEYISQDAFVLILLAANAGIVISLLPEKNRTDKQNNNQ